MRIDTTAASDPAVIGAKLAPVAVERLGTVTHEVRRAKEDGKILPSEFSRITFFIRDLERLCAEVRETLKAEVTPE